MRRCFQQAYTWLGYYEGPINGLMTEVTQQAQLRYFQTKGISTDNPNAAQTLLAVMEADLRRVGRHAAWRDCLSMVIPLPQ
jgi:hypothetical protein